MNTIFMIRIKHIPRTEQCRQIVEAEFIGTNYDPATNLTIILMCPLSNVLRNKTNPRAPMLDK